MCLLVLAWNAHPRYRLILAANRDEFHDRPAAPLAEWPELPQVFAGRDLRAGGTWLAVERAGRFGVVTNFRELQRPRPGAPSRGRLIPAFLGARTGAAQFARDLEPEAGAYAGFNLLVGDAQELWYLTNRAERFATRLEPGVYGLSNHVLDAPWPKLERVRRRFRELLAHAQPAADALFDVLADRRRTAVPADGSSGLSAEWEQVLSSPFVLDPRYGTRCSTVLRIERSGAAWIGERRFDPTGTLTGETELELNAPAPEPSGGTGVAAGHSQG